MGVCKTRLVHNIVRQANSREVMHIRKTRGLKEVVANPTSEPRLFEYDWDVLTPCRHGNPEF